MREKSEWRRCPPWGALVIEDYNETYLTPYPSHDGQAIVNRQGGFFDKVFIMESGTFPGPFILQLEVENT